MTAGAPTRLTAAIAAAAALLLAIAGARPTAAQSNAAPLWSESFRTAGFGTANPVLSAEDLNFLIDATERGAALSPAERARAADLMDRSAAMRAQFAAAAAVRRCDWELDRARGFSLELPHLANMRQAARILKVQAKWQLDEGRGAEAVASLAALGAMAAQPGQDDIAISSLVGSAIAAQVSEAVGSAIDHGAIDAPAAEKLIDAFAGLKGDDAFRYGAAVLGEERMVRASIDGCRSDADLRKLLAGATDGAVRQPPSLAEAQQQLGQLRPLYERAAKALANPDAAAAEAELRRIDAAAEAGRFGSLAGLLAPDFVKLLQSKLAAQESVARLLATLQAIADGTQKPDDLRNAAVFLARASAAARAQPTDVQETVELLRLAPAAAEGEALARASVALDRARDDAFARLADAAACRRCDFAALRGPVPSLEPALLGGIRGAVRMSLADGLRKAREDKSAAAVATPVATACRVASHLASDPTLARAMVAQRIWREATAALADAAKCGPLPADAAERIEIAARTMPAADPFGFRLALERDAAAILTGRAGPEARLDPGDPRAQLLRQRGPSALLGYVAWLAAAEDAPLPSADDAALVSVIDLYPADALASVRSAADAWRAAPEDRRPAARPDIPASLPEDEQRSRTRAFDPSRGVRFVDAASLAAAAGSDYAAMFEATARAAKAPAVTE